MVTESIQQYRDYYESDVEENHFFEYLDNLSNRDKIRLTEIFEDPSIDRQDLKDYMMIEKREYNPKLSIFSNFLLDLVDFKDRVVPLAKDIALMDIQRKYQKQNVTELLEEKEEAFREFRELREDLQRLELEEGSTKELESSRRQ
jgi:hypothetical protein